MKPRPARTTRSRPADAGKQNGPGWITVVSFSIMSFAAGAATAAVSIDSANILETYVENAPVTLTNPPDLELARYDHPNPTAKPEWFPESNHVEWAISLRPGVSTVPVKIENLSAKHNHRILFQHDRGTAEPQLAATLFLRAQDQATLQLPPATYRIDVVSTPIDMKWVIAKEQYASPRMKIELERPSGSFVVQQQLQITDGGTLRRRRPKTHRGSATEKAKSQSQSTSTTEAEVDYGEIEVPHNETAASET